MDKIQSSQWFMLFIAMNDDENQIYSIVKNINEDQLQYLEEIADSIITGEIHLNNTQFKKLYQHQDFIRSLSEGRAGTNKLTKNIDSIIEICKVVYPPNEIRNKIGTFTNRRLGKGKETFTSEKYSEYSRSGESSSQESESESGWENYAGENESDYEEEVKGGFEADGEENESGAFYNKFIAKEI